MSEIAKQAKSIIDAQVKKGIEKYNMTLDENIAPMVERIDHLCEEMADGLQYALWIKQRMQIIESKTCTDTCLEIVRHFENQKVITQAELVSFCLKLSDSKNSYRHATTNS